MLSASVEDYLKAIHALQEKESLAKTGALAENLRLSSGSVSEMLKRMAGMSPPLIVYRQHHGATLTRQGRLKAMAVIRKHRLLETFLYQVLKLDWDSGVMSSPMGEKLTGLAPGEKFRIVRVDPSMDGILTYLDNLGLGIDSAGEVVSQSTVGETVSLRIMTDRGSHDMVIGFKAAENIYVLND